jgi:hypothetical protein
MSKEDFKTFVRDNPSLINYVKNNEMTWQKFYEMYDLYGSDNSVWNKYLNNSDSSISTSNLSLKDLISIAKGIDLATIQRGIGSLEKVVGVIRDVTLKDTSSASSRSSYEPRPIYKYFED